MKSKSKEEIQVINMKVFKLNQMLERIQDRKRSKEEIQRLTGIGIVKRVKSSTFTKYKKYLKNKYFQAILLAIIVILLTFLIIL